MSRLSLKGRSVFRTDAKIYLLISEKKYFGVRCTLIIREEGLMAKNDIRHHLKINTCNLFAQASLWYL